MPVEPIRDSSRKAAEPARLCPAPGKPCEAYWSGSVDLPNRTQSTQRRLNFEVKPYSRKEMDWWSRTGRRGGQRCSVRTPFYLAQKLLHPRYVSSISCQQRWLPLCLVVATSWRLPANGVGGAGAQCFDSPPATTVEQRPLQLPGSPRRQVQRWRWSCPRRWRAPFSTAGAQQAATILA